MKISQIPTKFPIPFANAPAGGDSNPIPTASQIAITPGAASLTDGFPPLCFQQITAGGVPPWGRDVNGLFNQVTAWNRWGAAGNPVQYDSVFATAIGGYPFGTVLAAQAGVTAGSPQGGNHLWFSTVDDNIVNPDSTFNSANWVPFPAVINTDIAYTVGGTGSQFPDLNTAFEYLSRFAITGINGSVILQLAGAPSGTAQQFTYTSPINMSHPNNDRISVIGATMLGAVPTSDASYAINGSSAAQRATDTATNLATLRTKFATELHFSGCGGFVITGKCPNIDGILLTGDGSANNGIIIRASCPAYPLTPNGIAVVGFGFSGVWLSGSSWNITAPLVIINCGTNNGTYAPAFRLQTSQFGSSSSVIVLACGNTTVTTAAGLSLELNSALTLFTPSTNLHVDCNQNDGVDLQGNSTIANNNNIVHHFYRNGAWGLNLLNQSFVSLTSADFGSTGSSLQNGTGSIQAFDNSAANLNGQATNVTSPSPAVGTVGNNQSLIANS